MVQRSEPAIALALVDAQTIFRECLRALVDREPDLTVVASAADLAAVEKAGVTPRVVVTELTLPDAPPDEVVPRLHADFPGAAIVVLTALADLATVQRTIASGASGYVSKNASAAELLAGVRAVACGSAYLEPAIGVAFASRPPLDAARLDGGGLTPKETEVLRLLALGHTNAEIAQLLGASLRTIESHRSHIHQKLGRHTRAELVRYSLDTGLLRADSGRGVAATDGPPVRTDD